MRTLAKPFTTSILKVAILDDISDKYWQKIVDEIDVLTAKIITELEPNRTNSLDKINSTPVGQEVKITRLSADFLHINWDYYHRSNGKFQPFSSSLTELPFEIDFKQMVLVKHEPFLLNPAKLLRPITADLVVEILNRMNLDNFLVKLGDIYISSGREPWEVEFEHPYINDLITTVIEDQAVCMAITSNPPKQTDPNNPFAAKSQNIAALSEAGIASHAYISAGIAVDLYLNSELQDLAQIWAVGLTTFDQNGSYRQFQPIS